MTHFNGSWRLTAHEGDWEAYLKAMRLPPDFVIMAKAVNFGLLESRTRKRATTTITVYPDEQQVKLVNHDSNIPQQKPEDDDEDERDVVKPVQPPKEEVVILRTDGQLHRLIEDDPTSMTVVRWEGATLISSAPGDGEFRPPTSSRRWLRDIDTMVLEMTCEFATARRVFVRVTD